MIFLVIGLALISALALMSFWVEFYPAPARTMMGVTTAIAVMAWFGMAYLYLGMRCDEVCHDGLTVTGPPADWTEFESSWQWGAQFALAALGSVAGIAAVLLSGRDSGRATRLALGATAVFFTAWIILMWPEL